MRDDEDDDDDYDDDDDEGVPHWERDFYSVPSRLKSRLLEIGNSCTSIIPIIRFQDYRISRLQYVNVWSPVNLEIETLNLEILSTCDLGH